MAENIDAKQWDSVVAKAKVPVVVEFWHDQCVWCKRLAPVYDELSKEYKEAKLVRLNVLSSTGNQEIGERYGIMGTPTMKVFCNGREVGEVVGYMEKKELRNKIDDILKKSEACLASSTPLT